MAEKIVRRASGGRSPLAAAESFSSASRSVTSVAGSVSARPRISLEARARASSRSKISRSSRAISVRSSATVRRESMRQPAVVVLLVELVLEDDVVEVLVLVDSVFFSLALVVDSLLSLFFDEPPLL